MLLQSVLELFCSIDAQRVFQLGWTHFSKPSYELLSQNDWMNIEFQLARLETYQVGNAISPTWFVNRSMPVYFS